MRLLMTLVGTAAVVFAQQAAAKTFTSAADVAAMIMKPKKERKPDQANFIQPLVQAAPYTGNLEYRVKDVKGNPTVHETKQKCSMSSKGRSATLVTGGKL